MIFPSLVHVLLPCCQYRRTPPSKMAAPTLTLLTSCAVVDRPSVVWFQFDKPGSVLSQVPRSRVQIWSAGAAGRGGPDPPQHGGGRPLGRPGAAGQPPPGADGGRPDEAAASPAAAAHQRRPAVPHRPGDVPGARARGAEVRLQGAPLLRHPRRRRDPGGAPSQEPLQLLGSLSKGALRLWTREEMFGKRTRTGSLTWVSADNNTCFRLECKKFSARCKIFLIYAILHLHNNAMWD